MRRVTFHGMPDPVIGWDGCQAYVDADVAAGTEPPKTLDGAAAGIQSLPGGGLRVFRDRLGIGKLYWARGADGGLDFASRPLALLRAGHGFEAVSAVPRGALVELDGEGRPVHRHIAPLPSAPDGATPPALEESGARIRTALDAYLAAVAAACRGRPAFVCLSGGLDSSTVAVLARRHFPDLTAVSFDIAGAGRATSEDRIAARRLAADLDLPLVEADATVEDLLSNLDTVLIEGIDWRDFNVHAALVNAVLADAMAAHRPGNAPLVITGDLANEFLVDYKAEVYRGVTYYALPRLDAGRVRAILIQGLESTHREVGVFAARGLALAQPYVAAIDAYLALPPAFLENDTRKDVLVRHVLGSELPDYIYERPKTRAQVGGTDGGFGVLGACIDRGIDAAFLKRRWTELHGIDDAEALGRFIRAGRTRAAIPNTTETVHERA